MGQGLPKNHKKYGNDFCSANNCRKCLVVEINFSLQKCRLHSVYGSLSVNFNQGSLLYELQKESYPSLFCATNADFSKENFKQWFLKGSSFTVKYFWWVTRPPVSHFWFYEFFCWDVHSRFCSKSTVHFFNTWKNHWVPILSIVQPTVKTGTQLFQQIGDTQKSQVFLKRKKLFGGPPLTFQKAVNFMRTVSPTVRGGRVRVGGWGLGWGGRYSSTMPCMDLERFTFYIDYKAFKKWH